MSDAFHLCTTPFFSQCQKDIKTRESEKQTTHRVGEEENNRDIWNSAGIPLFSLLFLHYQLPTSFLSLSLSAPPVASTLPPPPTTVAPIREEVSENGGGGGGGSRMFPLRPPPPIRLSSSSSCKPYTKGSVEKDPHLNQLQKLCSSFSTPPTPPKR